MLVVHTNVKLDCEHIGKTSIGLSVTFCVIFPTPTVSSERGIHSQPSDGLVLRPWPSMWKRRNLCIKRTADETSGSGMGECIGQSPPSKMWRQWHGFRDLGAAVLAFIMVSVMNAICKRQRGDYTSEMRPGTGDATGRFFRQFCYPRSNWRGPHRPRPTTIRRRMQCS
jgi:hypothetical protein